MEYKDYYKILGVKKDADKDTISRAYKKLARKYHPDLNQGNKSAEEKFKDVTEAYEVLKDDKKRQTYDQLGPEWQQAQRYGNAGGFGGSTHFSFNGQEFDASAFDDFGDFFTNLFGGAGKHKGRSNPFGADPFANFSSRPQRGQDLESEITITLEDAVKGGEKQISLDGGTRTLKVNIPSGIHEGAKLRLPKQGYISPTGIPEHNGDLYLKIHFAQHPDFQVDGKDLIHEIFLNPWDAVLGTKVCVPTLEGKVELSVPPGTSSGKKLRLRGKGLGSGASRGDEYIRIAIKIPAQLTSRQKELWEALATEAKR